MFKNKWSKTTLSAAVLTAATAVATGPGVASAASAPLSCARIAAHFDLTRHQMPENIALAPDGSAYVTFAAARQVARIDSRGTTRILATLPAPADGGLHTPVLGFALTTGIVRAHDGTLYFLYATGTADLTGLWRLRPGGEPQRIAALPAAGLPNGLTLDPRTHTLYVTDSVLGTISSVPTSGGTPRTWSTAPELASTGFLGANGLKIRNGALWATNLDRGTLLRIPILRDGRALRGPDPGHRSHRYRRLRLHRPGRPDPCRPQRPRRGRPRPARRHPLYRPDRRRRPAEPHVRRPARRHRLRPERRLRHGQGPQPPPRPPGQVTPNGTGLADRVSHGAFVAKYFNHGLIAGRRSSCCRCFPRAPGRAVRPGAGPAGRCRGEADRGRAGRVGDPCET